MVSALINGFIGLGLSLYVGIKHFDCSLSDVLSWVVASNLAGIVALLATLKAESVPWMRQNLLNHTLKTWSFLAILYFFLLVVISPPFQGFNHFFAMLIPLLFSQGFGIILFGPIQDSLVRRQQLKVQELSSPEESSELTIEI
jgi:hypothetical protein